MWNQRAVVIREASIKIDGTHGLGTSASWAVGQEQEVRSIWDGQWAEAGGKPTTGGRDGGGGEAEKADDCAGELHVDSWVMSLEVVEGKQDGGIEGVVKKERVLEKEHVFYRQLRAPYPSSSLPIGIDHLAVWYPGKEHLQVKIPKSEAVLGLALC